MYLMVRPLLRYADFKGRARRAEYWLFFLFQFLVVAGLVLIATMSLFSGDMATALTGLMGTLALAGLASLVFLIPNLAVLTRRLHDINLSAWWMSLLLPSYLSQAMAIFTLIGIMGAAGSGADPQALQTAMLGAAATTSLLSIVGVACNLVLFVMCVWPGTIGPNRFGPDPKTGMSFDVAVFDDERIDSAIARAKAEAPHKPIFDFSPTSSGPMISDTAFADHCASDTNIAPKPWAAPAYDPGVKPARPFGRRS